MTKNRTFILVPLVACSTLLLYSCGDNPLVPTLDTVDEANVVFLSDFNDENGGAGATNWENFRDWNVVDGCVDLHGNGFYDVWPNNGLYVDLDGSCGKAGTMATKEAFSLSAGRYVLEFWLAGNNRTETPDTVIVTLGSEFTEQIIMEKKEPFRHFSREITVPSDASARLSFQNLGGDHRGALLDLVRLRRDP